MATVARVHVPRLFLLERRSENTFPSRISNANCFERGGRESSTRGPPIKK